MRIKQLGPYKILDVLGRGGMGTVYRALDEKSESEVAVKVLSAAYSDDDHFRSRFEAEINTLLQLDHPNIVRILSHGEDDGNFFFGMELVKGKSLHVLQKTGHRFSWQDVIGIAMDVCAGLQHAHLRGIVHRDIKPANLLRTQSGTTKITDFGIATLYGAERLTLHGGAIGTADFMSPEQASGELASERSDLFSLGCVMYALLAGRPPFAEKSVPLTIQSLNTKAPVQLRKLAPETPPDFADLIHRLLSKKPEDRLGTAQSLNRRLIDLLQLIKADADAQTAIAVELEEDDDDYQLAPGEATVDNPTFTSKVEMQTVEIQSEDSGQTTQSKTIVESDKSDYFKVVERKKQTTLDELENRKNGPVWPYVVAIVVVFGLIVWGLTATLLAQPSADQMYDAITSADNPKKADCDLFIQRFPDDQRVRRVESIMDEIESRKLEKRLALAKRVHGVRSMYPIEIMLLNAVEVRKDNPVESFERLEWLIQMYQGDDELTTKEQESLASANFFRTRFKDQAETYIEKHTLDIIRALKRADTLIEGGNAVDARRVLNGVVQNFSNQNWASQFVGQAKEKLAGLASPQ